MKLAILGKLTDRTNLEELGKFFHYLDEEDVQYLVDEPFAGELISRDGFGRYLDGKVVTDEKNFGGMDFAFSFGGDGTFLNTSAKVGKYDLPVLGVNSGRLGFLASIRQEEVISAAEALRRDMYKIDLRTAMSVDADPPGLFGPETFGLNDFTIHKSNTNEMITVHTFINGEFLNSYWGDGLIVATPTGSTAYSLSCGGPIIFPNSNVFVITPVAPHSLTVRPVIIPDDFVISFEIESRAGQAMVALDTKSQLVDARTEIAIRKSDIRIRMIRILSGNYLQTLRNRLMWGRDTRN